MRRAALIALVLSPVGAFADGVTVTANPDGPGVRVTHDGAHPIIAVKVGDRGLLSLFPGETLIVDAAPDAMVSGRFQLADWRAALDDLSAPWAEYHLRTAGFYLDALAPGPDGTPTQAQNLVALAAVSSETVSGWVRGPPLRLALVARAAQHAPASLLASLLSATSPTATPPPWPEAYAALEPLPLLVREAIERQGAGALPALLAAPLWAADRGFSDPTLAWAFPSMRDAVGDALTSRGDAMAKRALTVLDAAAAEPSADRLAVALEGDQTEEAIALAVRAATSWSVHQTQPASAETARLACAILDVGVSNALRRARFLAAEAHLRLAGGACGDRRIYRERAADVFGALGEQAVGRGDLATAAQWFRAARFFGNRAIDKARLADTLAEISLLHFRDGELLVGNEYLDEARDVGPLRPRVMEALGARPKADPRAKLAIFVIIVFIGLFAVRRLRRVWVGDGARDGRLKRRR